MKVNTFEELEVWSKAQDFAVIIYTEFDKSKDWGFKDQLTRAVVSISNNIAEGFDRNSTADFVRFLSFSLSSCSEVRSMLYLACRLNYLSSHRKDELIAQVKEISKMIAGLMRYLKQYQRTKS